MRLSTPKRGDAFIAAQDGGRDEAEATVSGENQKSVTIAPKTHCMTDRHYVQRKPLFTEEHRVSILKNLPEKEEPSGEHPSMKQGVNTPQTLGLSLRDLSLPTASGEKPSSTLIVPELCHRVPSSGSTFRGRSARRSFSSSILEVQSINPPLRPQLTSTVLNPTYTPRSYPRISQAHLRWKERSGVEGTKTGSSGSNSECQVDYWACAIPKALPPSPDRKSAAWNPNKEYEELLDYTYPLRPGHVNRGWNSPELLEDSLLRTEPNMKDSGIELDHLCSSASLSGFEPSDSGGGRSRDKSRSPDPQVFLASSDVPPCSTPLSVTNLTSLSVDSLDCSKDRAGSDQSRDGDDCGRHAEAASSSAAFIRSTDVLPRSRWAGGELDEEFWPLPEQLEELQQVSKQVREVAAQLSPLATARCASLDQDTTSSLLPSTTTPEMAQDKQDGCEGKRRCAAETTAAGGSGRDHEALRSSGGVKLKVGGQLSVTGVRECLLKQLCDGQEQSDSLIEHIQLFCSQLELLIQQLYALQQSMENIAAPAGDLVSVKSSLADYQSFQKELSSHQPLTSCVLRAGQHLLSCINSTSPLLRDALLLIQKQSGALQNHSDHVFSSILSAMDSLALPAHHGPAQLREEKNSAGI